MKNRIWNRRKRLYMAAFLLMSTIMGSWGKTGAVKAANVDNSGIGLQQTAVWTDEENYQAQVVTELTGLKSYIDTRAYQTAAAAALDHIEISSKTDMQINDTGEADLNRELNIIPLTYIENIPAAEGAVAEEAMPETDKAQVSETSPDKSSEAEAAMDTERLSEEDVPEEETGHNEVQAPANVPEEKAEDDTEEEDAADIFSAEDIPQLSLVNYISEYFSVDAKLLPPEVKTEELTVHGQNGKDVSITRIIYPIESSVLDQDKLTVTIPVTLRQDYRVSDKAMKYPVSQEEPLQKDRPGPGTFLAENTKDGQEIVLAKAASPRLEVFASSTDFSMELSAETDSPKAGEKISYELKISNTGTLPLARIRLETVFSHQGLSTVWEAAQDVEADGSQALLLRLDKGGECTLHFSTQLEEDFDGSLDCVVYASMLGHEGEGEPLKREAGLRLTVSPRKVDFTVEKTADRTIAMPGDTITYQICIRNTGERTLHSVVGTERFLNAGVQARFLERDGVVLNAGRTQAMISQIMPGEAFALEAAVTLPENFAAGDLLNQVTVVSRETGNKTVKSQAGVSVQAVQPTAAPTPVLTGQAYYQSGGGTKSSGTLARSAASQPKTADPSAPGLFALLLAGSFLSAAGAVWRGKAKRKH